jgi:hypothetical protein
MGNHCLFFLPIILCSAFTFSDVDKAHQVILLDADWQFYNGEITD